MTGLGILIWLSVVLSVTGLSKDDPVDINVATVRNIRASMKPYAAPCSNFWSYACGSWEFSNRNQRFRDNFAKLERHYETDMTAFFEARQTGEAAFYFVQQLRDYYAACIRQSVYHPQMERYLHELPDEVNIPKALFTEENYTPDANFSWISSSSQLRKFGLNSVYFEEVADVAYNDSLRLVLQLRMPAENSNFKRKSIFYDYMLDFGFIEQIDARAKQLADQAYALELELQRLKAKHRTAEPLLQTWTLLELQQHLPQIDWRTYFDELLQTDTDTLTDLRIEVSDVAYLRELGTLLEHTNKRTLIVYQCMQLCHFLLQARPRQLTSTGCVQHMRALLPLGMEYIYDRYVYKSRAQDTVQLQQIFNSLRATFAKYLHANNLQLTMEQLDYVRHKLNHMQLRLGNLPLETSTQFYNTHYSSANFTPSNFFHNHWQALRLRMLLQHAPLLQAGAKLQLQEYYVNDDVFQARTAPYFEHERNTLTVPLLFLQWPFFDHRQHAVFQHSLVGFILAHELSHAFEQQGILFDGNGNEQQLGLAIREQAKFKDALQCVQNMSTVSVKERLADFNGLQLAYDTFLGITRAGEQFEYLPYDFEPEFRAPQLFFLNFAQFFCGTLPQAIAHDADDVRVNASVANTLQFVNDFNCTRNEPDLAQVRCEMWRPI